MRLLDLFIGTLLVFPLLADAVWYVIPVPGFPSLDLSDLGVPFLAAGLIVLAVQHIPRLQLKSRAMVWSTPKRRAVVLSVALLMAIFPISYWAVTRGLLDADFVATVTWKMAHGTGAVVVVALVAAAMRRWSSEPWEGSIFVRLGARLAHAWRAAVERSPARSLWGAVAVLTAGFFCIALMRHRAFETHGYDLGIFTNTMWNLVHGNGYISSVKGGINLFADHQSPLFWVLAPVFWAFPRPETLLFVQSLGLTAGGPALYYLSRAQIGRGHWAQAALPWLYWSWLPLRNANAFDFHPEVFMLPLLLWAFVGFASERPWRKALGLLAVLAALGAKESAGVVVAGIGVAWALTGSAGSRSGPWPGIAMAIAGLTVLLFDLKVVPSFFGGDYAYMNLYGRFGGGIGDVLLAPVTQPGYFLSQVLNPARLNFLLWTLAPLGFLPLLNWRAAVAILPPYLALFLGEGDKRVRLGFHYGIEPGTALFWALPLGLAVLAERIGWRRAGIWMLFWALAFIGPSELTRARGYLRTDHARWLADQALPCVNQATPMAASDVLIPHLATRAWISYPDLLVQRPSGDPVACVVTDLHVNIDNWPLGKGETERVLSGLPARGYRETYRCGAFVVHARGTAACLRCMPACDGPPS